jgi:glycosidase
LPFRNPAIVDEWKGILKFWLDKGVRGFRMDAVPFLYEDPDFRSESRARLEI